MPLLQVRDCPEDVYTKIAKAAKQEKRTIAQQTIILLEKGLGQEESNMERRRLLIEKLQARNIPEKVKAVDSVALVREDRDR
ncbi:MAG: hypothetical protein WCQ50_16530 [Spirochaetota bacterium]